MRIRARRACCGRRGRGRVSRRQTGGLRCVPLAAEDGEYGNDGERRGRTSSPTHGSPTRTIQFRMPTTVSSHSRPSIWRLPMEGVPYMPNMESAAWMSLTSSRTVAVKRARSFVLPTALPLLVSFLGDESWAVGRPKPRPVAGLETAPLSFDLETEAGGVESCLEGEE